MPAQRLPLSQSLPRLAPWVALYVFPDIMVSYPILGPRLCWFRHHCPCSNLRLTPRGWKLAEEFQSRSPTRVGTCPSACQSIHVNPFIVRVHLILCTRHFWERLM